MVYQEFFIMMFNLLYTAYPVILMAVLDQDVPADTSLCYAQLYYPGLKGLLFNRTQFAASAWQGLWSSFVLIAITIGIFCYHNGISSACYMIWQFAAVLCCLQE